MSQDLCPEELSAEDIAHRIGAVRPAQPERARPEPVQPEPVRPVAPVVRVYPTRIAQQRPESLPVTVAERPDPLRVDRVSMPVSRPPEPRVRLIRDTAATLVGLSAVALIVIAVWPPSSGGGVLGVKGTAASATARPTPEPTPEPTATPTPDPTPTPAPEPTPE